MGRWLLRAAALTGLFHTDQGSCTSQLSFQAAPHKTVVSHGAARLELYPATRWDKQVYAFCAEHGITPNACASEFDEFSRLTKEGDVDLEAIRRASEGDTAWMRTDRRLIIVHRAYPRRSFNKQHIFKNKAQILLASLYTFARALSALQDSTIKLKLILMLDGFTSDDERRWLGADGIFERTIRHFSPHAFGPGGHWTIEAIESRKDNQSAPLAGLATTNNQQYAMVADLLERRLIDRDDIIVYGEDDYLFQPTAFKELVFFFLTYGPHWLTMYAGPNDFTTYGVKQNRAMIYHGLGLHWRSVESFTHSFATTAGKVVDYLMVLMRTSHNDVSLCRALTDAGEVMVHSLPALSAHMEVPYLGYHEEWEEMAYAALADATALMLRSDADFVGWLLRQR